MLPLDIVPDGRDFPVESLTGFDESDGPVWSTTDLARRFDSRRAA